MKKMLAGGLPASSLRGRVPAVALYFSVRSPVSWCSVMESFSLRFSAG